MDKPLPKNLRNTKIQYLLTARAEASPSWCGDFSRHIYDLSSRHSRDSPRQEPSCSLLKHMYFIREVNEEDLGPQFADAFEGL
jgi:hypothetical protein